MVEFKGFKIIGCDLWTDFQLNGNSGYAKQQAELAISDYREILKNESDALIEADDTVVWHRECVDFIYRSCNQADLPIILVTHHGISRQCIEPSYATSLYNPAYVSNLENMFDFVGNTPFLAINGHCHHYSFQTLDSGIIQYANPSDYRQPNFRDEIICVNKCQNGKVKINRVPFDF